MNRKHVALGLVVVVVLAVGVGYALYAGIGPAPGGGSGDDIEDFPTASDDGSTGSDGDSDTDSGSTTEAQPFYFTIDAVEECGTTCRDVTATLENNQNDTATGTTVYTRVFAGENNTDTADLVWEGTEDVGTLEAGASHTTTRRVELSLREARKVDQNDGWITIQTAVETDDKTVVFTDSEQMA